MFARLFPRERASGRVAQGSAHSPQPFILVTIVDPLTPHPAHPFVQELSTFVVAVIVGSLAGLATNLLLAHWVSAAAANNAALAIATTCTGAAHSHFVHKQPWIALLPKIGAGAPLAYGAMRLVHVVLGS